MTVVIDTSILIDVLRGVPASLELLKAHRKQGNLHANEVTRLEVLAGMRAREETSTRTLFTALSWHPLDEQIAEVAGKLGREWLPENSGIDAADLAVAATAVVLNAEVLTRNVKHFPMFEGISAPY